MANIANWVRIQMSSLVNSREKQLCEYHKNLLITQHINEILKRLVKLPLVTPKLWVHAKESFMGFDMSGWNSRGTSLQKEVFLWHLLTPPLFLMALCSPGLEGS